MGLRFDERTGLFDVDRCYRDYSRHYDRHTLFSAQDIGNRQYRYDNHGSDYLEFLLTTPGMVQKGYSFPSLSPMPGQFVAKDLPLLGAACWTAGEALIASKFPPH